MNDKEITKVNFTDDEKTENADYNDDSLDANVYTHKFNKPFEYEGRTFSEITFNWDSLTGKDSLAIENEMQSLGKPLLAPEFSGEYLLRMASRASVEKVGTDFFEALPLSDYNRIRSRARTFLLRAGQ